MTTPDRDGPGPIAHQASCVAIRGGAVLIEGPPGSGKSSLALALIDRGAVLIGDDGVLLQRSGARLLASAHPNIAGRLEIRNLGLIDLPIAPPTPVRLVLRLDPRAERFIDRADEIVLCGAVLPLIRLGPGSAVLPLKAERALEIYGLPE